MESYSIFRDLAIIIIFAKVFGIIARKCKAPQVVGEIIAGLLIGPSVLGLVQQSDFLIQMAETAERAFPETCRGAAAQQSCAPAGTLSSSMSRLSLPSFSAERSMPLEAMPIILRGGRFRIATTVLPTSSSGR